MLPGAYLIICDGLNCLEVLINKQVVSIVQHLGLLWRTERGGLAEAFMWPFSEQLTIEPCEKLIDAFLRQS